MVDSRFKYRAIPSSEDQDNPCDAVHNGGDDLHSTAIQCSFSIEAQTKWTYFLLGCAILLPWNALINATSFFTSRLAGSPFYSTFSSYLTSSFTLTNLAFQFYSTITSKQSSPSRRIFTSITVMTLFVTSLCLSTFVQGTPWAFFSFALLNAVVLAISGSYLCTAVLVVTALLGPDFLQTMLSGQAAAAVAVSLVQVVGSIISLRGSPPQSASMAVTGADSASHHAEELAARIFFGVSAVFLLVVLVVYAWLTKQPHYQSIISATVPRYESGDTEEHIGLIASDRRIPATGSNSHVYQVFKQNLIFMFSVAYVFAVTLSIYPGITTRVRSVDLGIHPLLFAALHFLAFNTGDFVGRYTCSFPRFIIWSANKILAMSLLRTLFIPLILFCNVQRPATAPPVSPWIHSDILYMIVLLAMGYTNGYVSSVALLAVSSLEHNPRLNGHCDDVDLAATLGGSFINVGLAVGALSSFGVQAML